MALIVNVDNDIWGGGSHVVDLGDNSLALLVKVLVTTLYLSVHEDLSLVDQYSRCLLG